MAVIHIVQFEKLKYVHITTDTYSGFLMASVQPGEATKHTVSHCQTHCLKCFSYMGYHRYWKIIMAPDILVIHFNNLYSMEEWT